MKRCAAAVMTLAAALLLGACSVPMPEEAAEEPPELFGVPVSESEAVEPTWFDHVVFIGDSVSVMLEYYNDQYGGLGRATFLCAECLTPSGALAYEAGNARLPEYPKGSGQHPKLLDSAAACGGDTFYIMLGMNCISEGVDRACRDLVTLVDELLVQVPDATILVESVTPMTADSPRADAQLNNDTIQAYNTQMQEICREREWYYVNVAEALSDENGFLRADYSGDKAMGIHLNYDGAGAWADYLLRHVPETLKYIENNLEDGEI